MSAVIKAEPGRPFARAVGDPNNASATWRFDLVPEGLGSRVRQHVQLGPGPSGLTYRIGEVPDREQEVISDRIDGLRSNTD